MTFAGQVSGCFRREKVSKYLRSVGVCNKVLCNNRFFLVIWDSAEENLMQHDSWACKKVFPENFRRSFWAIEIISASGFPLKHHFLDSFMSKLLIFHLFSTAKKNAKRRCARTSIPEWMFIFCFLFVLVSILFLAFLIVVIQFAYSLWHRKISENRFPKVVNL